MARKLPLGAAFATSGQSPETRRNSPFSELVCAGLWRILTRLMSTSATHSVHSTRGEGRVQGVDHVVHFVTFPELFVQSCDVMFAFAYRTRV